MPFLNTTAGAEEKSVDLIIDGNNAITAENKLYRGLGMVSGNNSSRLLLDYKDENPEKYNEILNYIFGADGIGITHLKLEMGSDINSSSGTEPSVMRTEDEKADVTRGAGFQLAADAKKINPDLTLDMLWWSEPLWISNAEDVYAARYKWYKSILDAAYETYNLTFDYVSANQNERRIDAGWIKYLSSHLKSETDCPYDYSKIKIVAADEVGTWVIGAVMLKDEELLNAVDVIGGHYSDWTNDKIKELAADYGKEIWFSEGSSPMSYSNGTYKYDGSKSGLSDINGVLDIANRIITMFPGGDMTLYEFQPVVSAYYDGVTYCQKQLITAEKPWSGYYTLDSGFYMSLHFSQFFKKGWCFIDGACAGDGKAGGDGHAIVDAVYSYMTAADSDSGDYSTVITNTTDSNITYNITVKNLAKAGQNVCVFETRGPDGNKYDENYFKKIGTITPQKNGDDYTYSVTVKPYSMVTLSTLE
ncbi:MAG: glycosyl hydrolase family 59, partial [Ruminiclostridium sp.]|nr:glycosyl hydrolase family 59 [Ruminiclostridium sp.]